MTKPLTRGQARFYAVQALRPVAGGGVFARRARWPLYTPIPVFGSRRDNRAVDREADRIVRRRTYRRRTGPGPDDWGSGE